MTIFYLDGTSGNDGNDGLSSGAPKLTLNGICSGTYSEDLPSGATTLYIKRGTTVEGTCTTAGGKFNLPSGASLTIRHYGAGPDPAVLKPGYGFLIADDSCSVDFEGGSAIRSDELQFVDDPSLYPVAQVAACLIDSQHLGDVRVVNCKTDGWFNVIRSKGATLTVTGCTLVNIRNMGVYGNDSASTVTGPLDVTVTDNFVSGFVSAVATGSDGLALKAAPSATTGTKVFARNECEGFVENGIDIQEVHPGTLIEDNWVHDCGQYGIVTGHGSLSPNIIIRRNLIEDCGGGIQCGTTDLRVEANVCLRITKIGRSGFLVGEFAYGLTLVGNVLEDDGQDGITTAHLDFGDIADPTGVVANNVFRRKNATSTTSRIVKFQTDADDLSGLLFSDNRYITEDDDDQFVRTVTPAASLTWTTAKSTYPTFFDDTQKTTLATIDVDASYKPTAASPMVGAGTDVGVGRDKAGRARPVEAPTIGAYEPDTERVYVVVYPSSATAPTDEQVVAGLDGDGNIGVFYGSEDSPGAAGSYSFSPDASGLTASTEYSYSVVVFDGTTYSNVDEYATFTTSAGTVSGTSATTNADDAAAASGTTTVAGSSATTNADDAGSASGTVGGGVSGSAATTNADDAAAAQGTTTVAGTSATTNADDAAAGSGTTTITGLLATTNADDVAAAFGVAGSVSGTSATTNADDIASAAGYPGDAPTSGAAGSGSRRSKRVAIERGGRIETFESEAEAAAWIEAQAPRQAKVVKKIARKAIQRAAEKGLPVVEAVFKAPEVVDGGPEIRALANLRASILQGMLDAEIRDQLLAETLDEEDEHMAAAVMLMMI